MAATRILCHKCQGSLFTLMKSDDNVTLIVQCIKCNMQGSISWVPDKS